MKKIISTLILLILIFFIFEFGITFFKDGHEVSYEVFVDDKKFEIVENYKKENNDNYYIKITNGNEMYYYIIANNLNKQKEIINKIEYFTNNDISCIYPILTSGEGTYLQCYNNDNIYSGLALDNQSFISSIKSSLKEKGYHLYKDADLKNAEVLGNTNVYVDNLLEEDIIALWSYKAIDVFKKENLGRVNVLSFDKYENTHGYLVDNYYVVPNYLSDKVLEFSSVSVVDIRDNSYKLVKLGYTLSSRTYVNGDIDGKIYYTDPSNLIQLEFNPGGKEGNEARLIGNKDIGGQFYSEGKWNDRNIYDFVNNKLVFKDEIEELKGYSYEDAIETDSCYYYYNNKGEVYQLSKVFLDKPVLLFKANGINNFNAIQDTIYYVVDNTLYYYSNMDGQVPLFKNNELRYNKLNRIGIYRKS